MKKFLRPILLGSCLLTLVRSTNAERVASFSFSPSSPTAGSAVTFNASSTVCTVTPCTYQWTDEKDGSVLGSGVIFQFIFRQAGTKLIRLTVRDNLKRPSIIEHDVVVVGPPPPPPLPPPTTSTEYYLDPDYVGTVKDGSTSQPWTTLGSAEWSTINTALASHNVTVYFSSRKTASDTDQTYGAPDEIDLNNKTTNGFRLILDGHTKYNSSDTIPDWQNYSGDAKARVKSFYGQNSTHTKHNKITIDGFRVVRTSPGSAVAICGDDWTVRNSDISHTSGATDGPLVLLVPTANAANEGSEWWCPASSNITIENNTIHDSWGELVYVGGAGCASEDITGLTSCGGFPSHTNILIQNNTLFNGGAWGPQGDGIDVKAGLTNLRIRHNTIYDLLDVANSGVRAIVIGGARTTDPDQNILVENNLIYNIRAEDAAIALVDGWGTPRGVELRNNVIASLLRGQGIKVYRGSNHSLYNNTIYKTTGEGIAIVTGAAKVINNLLIDNNTGGAQASFGSATVTSSNNAYSGTFGADCVSCVSGLSATTFNSTGPNDLHLAPGSAAIDRGTPLSFNVDRDGVTRPWGLAWDIGAYEVFTSFPPQPPPPSGTVYYVSNSGSDTSSGTTPSASWKTVTKVEGMLSSLKPGDSVLFLCGDVWNEQFDLSNVHGTATSSITIGHYGSNCKLPNQTYTATLPVINGGSTRQHGFYSTGGISYLVIDGFDIHDTTMGGIELETGSLEPGLVIQNNLVHQVGAGACAGCGTPHDDGSYNAGLGFRDFSGGSPDGIQILNNTVWDVGGHNTIGVHYDTSPNMRVSGNLVGPGCIHNCIDTKGVSGTINNNITTCGTGRGEQCGSGNAGFYTENTFTPSMKITYRNNTAYNIGIGFQAEAGGACASKSGGNCSITASYYNNTVFNVSNFSFIYSSGRSIDSFDIRNNIFHGAPVRTGGMVIENHNNCYGGASCSGTADLSIDPQFLSPSTGDFHLTPTSPVIGKGVDVGLGLFGLTPNIGAY